MAALAIVDTKLNHKLALALLTARTLFGDTYTTSFCCRKKYGDVKMLTKGMALSLGAVCTSLAMIGNVLTKMVDGTLSDRFGATRVSALFCFLGAAAEAVIFLTGGKTGLLAASLLMGANYAVSGLSMSLVTMEVYGPKQYGFAYASQVFVCTVLSAVTNLLWGVNYDLAGNYSAIMLFSMGWALLAGISMLLLDRRLRRDR